MTVTGLEEGVPFLMCTHTLYKLPEGQVIPLGSIGMHPYVLTMAIDEREKGL